MNDTGKRYYIVDTHSGNYYKLDERGQLVQARNSDEAALFTGREAKQRIGAGKKARFYTMVEVPEIYPVESEPYSIGDAEAYDAADYDSVEKTAIFDSLNNNWEEMLSLLSYMSTHMDEYRMKLKLMLSDVDKEICDVMHYLEFNELSDAQMLMASHMLQERRQYRRKIKDEMEKTALMRSSFLNPQFGIKVRQSLKTMQRMKTRCYTPRRLSGLFEGQRIQDPDIKKNREQELIPC